MRSERDFPSYTKIVSPRRKDLLNLEYSNNRELAGALALHKSKIKVSVYMFIRRIYNLAPPSAPASVIGVSELLFLCGPVASPEEKPKLRVIIVAGATYR